jgi:hypothetical protein
MPGSGRIVVSDAVRVIVTVSVDGHCFTGARRGYDLGGGKQSATAGELGLTTVGVTVHGQDLPAQ